MLRKMRELSTTFTRFILIVVLMLSIDDRESFIYIYLTNMYFHHTMTKAHMKV